MKNFVTLLFVLSTAVAQPETARDLNERGAAAYSRGDYAAAERLYREAIPQWQNLGERFTAHLAITEMNLGNALSGQGKRAEALPEMKESLALFRRSLGVRDARTLDCMNILAGLEMMRGDNTRADSLLGEALRTERKFLPADVTLARTLSVTAMLRVWQGRISEALPAAEESLELAIKTAGEESADAALAYSAVAEAHWMAGQPARALPLYRRARFIYAKRLGPDHPRVAVVMSREAMILAGEGELATAAAEIRQALAMLHQSCPGCAFERSTLDSGLAHVRLRQGKRAEAARLFAAARALRQESQAPPPERGDAARSQGEGRGASQ